jgi:mono/diheme cytochrome c family protein
MLGTRAAAAAGLMIGAVGFVPAALGHPTSTTPKLVGNPTAGKAVYTANCSACHTLKAAGAVGVNGPNLDKLVLPEATIIKETQIGGSSMMGAAGKKYPIQMPGYKASLSAKQINDVSAFIYVSTHKT